MDDEIDPIIPEEAEDDKFDENGMPKKIPPIGDTDDEDEKSDVEEDEEDVL